MNKTLEKLKVDLAWAKTRAIGASYEASDRASDLAKARVSDLASSMAESWAKARVERIKADIAELEQDK